MKSVKKAYLLWLAGFFGCLGFHRFYLNKHRTGKLYFHTLGLLFLGRLNDLIFIPAMVEKYNLKLLLKYLKKDYERVIKIKKIVVDVENYESASWCRDQENDILVDIEKCKILLKKYEKKANTYIK